jgi:predicted nucleic acid-binding protein
VTRVILDTGPLVALLAAQDSMHDWAKETIARLEPPLSTCDAVLTEACYLLRKTKRGVEGVLTLVRRWASMRVSRCRLLTLALSE